jgi:hypothetical protein
MPRSLFRSQYKHCSQTTPPERRVNKNIGQVTNACVHRSIPNRRVIICNNNGVIALNSYFNSIFLFSYHKCIAFGSIGLSLTVTRKKLLPMMSEQRMRGFSSTVFFVTAYAAQVVGYCEEKYQSSHNFWLYLDLCKIKKTRN